MVSDPAYPSSPKGSTRKATPAIAPATAALGSLTKADPAVTPPQDPTIQSKGRKRPATPIVPASRVRAPNGKAPAAPKITEDIPALIVSAPAAMSPETPVVPAAPSEPLLEIAVAASPIASKATVALEPAAAPDSQSRTTSPADTYRTLVGGSLDRARAAFSTSQQASQSLAKGLEDSGEALQSAFRTLQNRMVDAIEEQANLAFGYWRDLSKVKTLSDAIDLQSTHFRRNVEVSLEEAREITALASKTATEAADPVRKALNSVTKRDALGH